MQTFGDSADVVIDFRSGALNQITVTVTDSNNTTDSDSEILTCSTDGGGPWD